MMKKALIIPIVLFLLSAKCQSDKNNKVNSLNEIASDTFKTSLVYPKVKTLKYSNEYCLYLPEKFKYQKSLPCIIFFDPAANGMFPVKKYKFLAEQFGYILVGLNGVKNGMQWELVQTIAQSVIEDCTTRFHPDNKRIYVSGFSGGSRYALALSLADIHIAGVIACGAGMPAINLPVTRTFLYCAMAGLDDFNYTELRNLTKSLVGTPLRHIFVEFEGDHAWPDTSIYSEGLYWFEFEAMRDHLILKDSQLIQLFISKSLMEPYKHPALAERTLIRKQNMVNGLYSSLDFVNKLDILKVTTDILSDIAIEDAALAQENTLQEKYLQALPAQSLEWWKIEIDKLWKKTKSSNFYETKVFQRVLNYISLACFMQCSQNYKQNQQAFEHFLTLYEWVDPDNPDVYYFKALNYMKQNNKSGALDALKTCVKFGFNDKERLLCDKAFSNLHLESGWNELMSSFQ